MARFKARYNDEEAYYPIEIRDTFKGILTDLSIVDAEQLIDALTVIIDEAKARLEADK